ncbi:hypothetical protein FOL47_010528 [Perkinsus chesapeaki]|uniref:Dynactin subunit 4 n=1 Tax=Perkinsus chesapeaki TaxID=330153 RepID=A0A7J6MPH2_PERCH|nr:hypothetical protein FOL47_010528 [Perkinsus chesapeaki]
MSSKTYPKVDYYNSCRGYLKNLLNDDDDVGVRYITGWRRQQGSEHARDDEGEVNCIRPVEEWRSEHSIYELFACSKCNSLVSPYEIDEEVVSYYCPSCLDVLPQSAVTATEEQLESKDKLFELACSSGCSYRSSIVALIESSPEALLNKARNDNDNAFGAWMREVLPVYRERCLKTTEVSSSRRSSVGRSSGWRFVGGCVTWSIEGHGNDDELLRMACRVWLYSGLMPCFCYRAVRHARSSSSSSSSSWTLEDLETKVARATGPEGDFIRDGLPLCKNEDSNVSVLFTNGVTVEELKERKEASQLAMPTPLRCPLASRRSYRHAAECKRLLLKCQILPDHNQPYPMRAYASDSVPLCALRDISGGVRPTMRPDDETLDFYLTLRNPRAEPMEVHFDTRLGDKYLTYMLPPYHSNWPGEMSQFKARHSETLPNLRFITNPFTVVIGGSDVDLSESEIMPSNENPPELVQAQRHRAAVKLSVRKAAISGVSLDEVEKSPLREGLSRVSLKAHPPTHKHWQALLRLRVSSSPPGDPSAVDGEGGMELLLRIRLGKIEHAEDG